MGEKGPKTEITIAVIGLIGVLGAAVIANWQKIFPNGNTNNNPVLNGNISPSPGPQQSPSKTDQTQCLSVFLQGVPNDRVKIIESGSKDLQVIGPDQSKDQPIALRLEEDKKLVGAIRFQYFSNGSMFKIGSIIDSQCQRIEDFVNATRGGDKHVLQNYDNVEIQIGNARYGLDLEYGSGKIDVDFARISPKP
jgi:hypothetical protein